MTLRTATASAATLFGLLAGSSAFAQESTIQPPTAPPAAVATQDGTQQAPRFSAGLQLELLPRGKLDVAGGGGHQGHDLTTGFGVGGVFACDLTPNFSLGVAPRVVFDVGVTSSTTDPMTEYDLRARAAVHGAIVPTLSLFAFGEPGYSWIIQDPGDDMSGFVAAFGGGVSYDISPGAFLSAEIGYQLGFQGVTTHGLTVDTHFDYLHVGVAGGARF